MREFFIYIGIFLFVDLVIYGISRRIRIHRAKQDAIYLQGISDQMAAKNEPITIPFLEHQDFDKYETKSTITLIRGRISASCEGNWDGGDTGRSWEVTINDGKKLWRDTMEHVGQMEVFCSKRNINLIIKKDGQVTKNS